MCESKLTSNDRFWLLFCLIVATVAISMTSIISVYYSRMDKLMIESGHTYGPKQFQTTSTMNTWYREDK